MNKNATSTESNPTSQKPASEEQIKEYQKLKARNEWIQMNKIYLDQIQRKQLFYHRFIFWFVVFNLIVSLLSYLSCLKF